MMGQLMSEAARTGKPEIDLKPNTVDHVTSMVKGLLGTIPMAGDFLSELVGNIIPNQRVDRIAQYVGILGNRLDELDPKLLQAKLSDPLAIDLVEESFYQAIRAITVERKERIAATVKNGLARDDQGVEAGKRFLLLLAELDDIDLIFLMAYARHWDRNDPFIRENWEILKPIPVNHGRGSTIKDNEGAELREYRITRLEQLKLIRARYKVDSKTKAPVFDSNKRQFNRESTNVTTLGRLLLSFLDME